MYSRLLFDALATSEALSKSWQHPKHRDRTREREALYYALHLDQDGQTVLDDHRTMPSVSVETRYEIHAAIRLVHAILPFTLGELEVLTTPEIMRNRQFEDESAVPDRLLSRWHEWLWIDEHGVPQTSTKALGASALLQEGCGRLAASLPEVMDRIGLSLPTR